MSPSPAVSELDSEPDSNYTKPTIATTLPTTPTASKVSILSSTFDEEISNSGTGSTSLTPAEPSPNTAKRTFYSPIAAFLRARYPSVRTNSPTPTMPPVKVEAELAPSEDTMDSSISQALAGSREDADETSTIKGSIRGKSMLFSNVGSPDEEPDQTSPSLIATEIK